MQTGQNRVLVVIVGIVLIIAGVELLFFPVRPKKDSPSPRALAAFATETTTPDCDSACATKLAPTVANLEERLCLVQNTLIPELGTAVAIIAGVIPSQSPVASPSATSTTAVRTATPTFTPPVPHMCESLSAAECDKYGLVVNDCGIGYRSICVRKTSMNGDCTWCRNFRP